MVLAYITCKNKKEAKEIASSLLNKKLIACANIFPIESMYRWKGKIQNDREVVLLAKTTSAKFKQVEKETKKMHSYEVPCILKINAKVNKEYGEWLKGEIC